VTVRYKIIESPVGPLRIAVSERGLRSLAFAHQERGAQLDPAWTHEPGLEDEIEEELRAYFAGELRKFQRRLDPEGTDFQKRVWTELQAIPYGETTSYGAIAQTLGQPGGARAVGAANGMNPIAIVVPCHRVIGKSGKMTGFAGGITIKRQLLDLEQAQAGAQLAFRL
jgi:methylated-DNA-[protein]-cysteine S-methyltransferase